VVVCEVKLYFFPNVYLVFIVLTIKIILGISEGAVRLGLRFHRQKSAILNQIVQNE
jgi:hypothetical protein